MSLASIISNKVGQNRLVNIEEIKKMAPMYSDSRIFQLLRKEVNDSVLAKRSRGLYYVPSETPFGPFVIGEDEIIDKLYIKDGDETIGFYAGLTLKNMLKMTMQHPAVVEICTNNESTRKRVVKVCNRFVVLRRARVRINNKNWKVLQFMELINSLNYEEIKRYLPIIKDFANKQGLTRFSLGEFLTDYPASVSAKLLFGGIFYALT